MNIKLYALIATISAFLIFTFYLLSKKNISYEDNFNNIKLSGITVKAIGKLNLSKPLGYNLQNNLAEFYILDKYNNEMFVQYKNPLPNNFNTSQTVVITGRFDKKNNIFQATIILTKCPSKYQKEANK